MRHVYVIATFLSATHIPNVSGYALVVYISLVRKATYHVQTMSIAIQRCPLTEARTEMIHGQHESSSSSICLAYPNLSHLRRKVLFVSRTCVINVGNFADKKKERQKGTAKQKRDHPPPCIKEWTLHPPPGSNCLVYSVPHAVIPRCCRFFGGLANSWQAAACVVVFVSGYTPTSA